MTLPLRLSEALAPVGLKDRPHRQYEQEEHTHRG
jgi:hypothetical protein